MLELHMSLNFTICIERGVTNVTFVISDLRVHSFHMMDKLRPVTKGSGTFSAHNILQFPVHRLDMCI